MIKAKNKGLASPVDPIYRIPDMMVSEKFLVERALTKLSQFEIDRSQWLQRREEYYLQWDDYVTPVTKGLWDGSSNIHVPLTEIQCNQMHARLLQSIFGVSPPFFVDPQEDIDEGRILKIERLMKYILMRSVNYNKGIYSTMDDFCWDLVTEGVGILSRDWRIEQRRFLKVVENPEFQSMTLDLQRMFNEDVDLEEFNMLSQEILKKPYMEQWVVRTVFNGAVVVAEDPSYILFKGAVVDSTDLNRHETVLKMCYFTKDELLAFKESEYFDEEVVDLIVSREPDKKGATQFTARQSKLNHLKDQVSGIQTVNSNYTDSTYEFICAYDTVNPSGKSGGYADRLVYFVHPATRTLARWTFLDRIVSDGKIPLHMSHLYRRPRRSLGRGLVETLLPINDMQDILLNQTIDSGTLANNPMGLYRGNGTFDPDEFRVEPGVMFKADDPNTDLRLLTWPINPNWSLPVQQMLTGMASQLTSLGAQASGQVAGPVGPMRSNAGLQSLFAQTDINLDVLFKRMNLDAISGLFEGLYQDYYERMPESQRITVVGMDGAPELDDNGQPMREDISKAELRGRMHFGLYANSQNMNKGMQLASAMQMSQFLLQRAPMELGVVGAAEVYNICDDIISNMGKLNKNRYIKKPQNVGAVPMNVELYSIAQGIMPTIILADPEHEEKIQKYDEMINSEQSVLEAQQGIIHKNAIELAKAAQKKHQKFLEVLKQAQNVNNPTGMNESPTLGLQGGQTPGEAPGANQERAQPESGREPQGEAAPQE